MRSLSSLSPLLHYHHHIPLPTTAPQGLPGRCLRHGPTLAWRQPGVPARRNQHHRCPLPCHSKCSRNPPKAAPDGADVQEFPEDLQFDRALDSRIVQGPPESQDWTQIWKKWQKSTAELRAKVAKLGLAAVLAYGLFDGITYTMFFVLAFLGYEKSTGKNPAANIQALIGVVILMWTGNNVTRPLRVAGAAAIAPFIDKSLTKIQEALNLPNKLFAFMLVVISFASLCLTIVGLLILSRWGR